MKVRVRLYAYICIFSQQTEVDYIVYFPPHKLLILLKKKTFFSFGSERIPTSKVLVCLLTARRVPQTAKFPLPLLRPRPAPPAQRPSQIAIPPSKPRPHTSDIENIKRKEYNNHYRFHATKSTQQRQIRGGKGGKRNSSAYKKGPSPSCAVECSGSPVCGRAPERQPLEILSFWTSSINFIHPTSPSAHPGDDQDGQPSPPELP